MSEHLYVTDMKNRTRRWDDGTIYFTGRTLQTHRTKKRFDPPVLTWYERAQFERFFRALGTDQGL